MPEAYERVLDQRLKELMEYGIIQRCIIDSICRYSKYRLTELGHALIPIIKQLRNWGNGFRTRMEEIIRRSALDIPTP